MAKTVAVVGASSDRRKFGNKALRAFQAEGYRVIPINPNETRSRRHGHVRVRARRAGADRHGDRLRAARRRLSLLPEFERKQIPEIWLNPGADSDEVLIEARRRKLNVIAACSIVAIGRNPGAF